MSMRSDKIWIVCPKSVKILWFLTDVVKQVDGSNWRGKLIVQLEWFFVFGILSLLKQFCMCVSLNLFLFSNMAIMHIDDSINGACIFDILDSYKTLAKMKNPISDVLVEKTCICKKVSCIPLYPIYSWIDSLYNYLNRLTYVWRWV